MSQYLDSPKYVSLNSALIQQCPSPELAVFLMSRNDLPPSSCHPSVSSVPEVVFPNSVILTVRVLYADVVALVGTIDIAFGAVDL